ncbi:CDP-alcohol phosphatidyltransferase family protein [Natranaerofaba carboxydovora]|uniref:CDP-alcohol phosphatidyltransferase family protein n=1 Tax=Natranaerofaba carboxydovora TaxID=2742683 RepID=UPI001F12F2C1|nr:CDP-alcohol phosphatidyltransferase family protein [Natranaerofaba carboxydovora]UMZ72776.1 Phosphatidylcholine synthase [Natranaerofaba carboxydovora]
MINTAKWLPSIFTFINLSLGFIALTLLYTDNTRLALSIIILALFFDGIDGRIARKLNVTSVVGKELDSLSDYFSFGIVPTYFYLVSPGELSIPYYIPSIIFLLFGTYHIAKYNAMFLYGSAKEEFPGLPINVAGIIVALISYLGVFPFFLEFIVIIVLGYLTITDIPYPSLKNYRPGKVYHLLIPIVAMIIFIAFPYLTLAVLSLYVIYGLVNMFIDFDNLKELKKYNI